MKGNKGVTLASLTVYIVVLGIILVALTFLSANLSSQIGEATIKGGLSNEYIKLYSFLISDLKSANRVLEFSNEYLRLDNDVEYTVKYIYDRATEQKQYEIYRNDVLITENFLDVAFGYDYDSNTCSIDLKYIYNKSLIEKTQTIQVGRGY